MMIFGVTIVLNAAQSDTLTLATNGASGYIITVSAEATEQEQHAAAELASFLRQVTGATFPVETKVDPGEQSVIAVGPSAARTIKPDLDLNGLGEEGIIIRSEGNHLILTGGEAASRGTLYAVYTFLEESVGCQWWTPTASTIPNRPTLEIPRQDHRYRPPFELRDPYIWDVFNQPDWQVRNRTNGQRSGLDPARGGTVNFRGHYHSFDRMLPSKEFFKDHPEWYTEINGKREGGGQLCLSNPEVLRLVTQKVRELLLNAPADTIVHVEQNDNQRYCQCAPCRAVDEEEGGPSGSLIRFVNGVAEGIEAEFPKASIETLAYQYSRKPPLVTKPRANVIVRMSSIICSFSNPFHHPQNRDFAEELEGWTKICQRVYIWDYITNFNHFLLPHPNLYVMSENLRYLAKTGVRGVFEQGAWKSFGGEFSPLRAWLLAKLLWNPEADERQLIARFLKGYYGAAAPQIGEYIELIHQSLREQGDYYMTMGNATPVPYLSVEILAAANALMDQAEEKVKGDAEILQRVRMVRVGVDYAVLSSWPLLKSDAEGRKVPWVFEATPQPILDRFLETCRLADVQALWEGGVTPEQFSRKFSASKEVPPPDGFEEIDDADWINFESTAILALFGGVSTERVSDPLSSSGMAIRMPPTHLQWAIQLTLPQFWLENGEVIADEGQEWTAYVVARVVKKGEGKGTAFSCGIYEPKNPQRGVEGRELVRRNVALADVDGKAYRTFKIGSTRLTAATSPTVWVAPTLNVDNVESIWIDRIFIVRSSAAIDPPSLHSNTSGTSALMLANAIPELGLSGCFHLTLSCQ